MGKVSRKKAIRSAPLKGYLPDEQISFNIRRLSAPRNPFLRTITLFPGEVRPVIVPGLDPGKETDLLAELKRFQNWKKVANFSKRLWYPGEPCVAKFWLWSTTG